MMLLEQFSTELRNFIKDHEVRLAVGYISDKPGGPVNGLIVRGRLSEFRKINLPSKVGDLPVIVKLEENFDLSDEEQRQEFLRIKG